MTRLTSTLLILFAVISLLFLTSPAMATPTLSFGYFTVGDSWTANFSLSSGSYTFDAIEAFIITDTGAGPFQNNGMFGFTNASWSASLINPNYTLATGNLPSSSSMSYSFDFAGNENQSVTIDLLAWTGGVGATLNFAASIKIADLSPSWKQGSGGGPYSFLLHPDGQGYNRAVPEPATLLLVGTGLVGLAGLRRKFRN